MLQSNESKAFFNSPFTTKQSLAALLWTTIRMVLKRASITIVDSLGIEPKKTSLRLTAQKISLRLIAAGYSRRMLIER